MKKSLLIKRLLPLKSMVILGIFLISMMVSCKEAFDSAQIESVGSTNKGLKDILTTLAYDSPSKLFNGNSGTYHSYRIPSLIKASNGTLIAFAEGRVNNNKDYGNINLICSRKGADFDNWNSIQIIAGDVDIYDNGVKVADKEGTFGNPTAVVDQQTNRTWLFML